jgi:tetratricopeptide (TPR) repeat protein
MNPPSTIPEVTPRRRRTLPPRSREEAYKRWLAVLFSVVTLLVGVATFLLSDASARSARLTRTAQQRAIDSTSVRTLGQQQSAYGYYLVARTYDELRAESNRFAVDGQPMNAGAYISASEQITPLSPLLAAPYTPELPDRSGWSGIGRYEADTWVVTSTLLSQQREALGTEANGWDNKSNNYVASIAIFAVVLFLFGLAATLGGLVRWMFVAVGLGLSGVTALGVLFTLVLPVHHLPDAALNAYARGAGLYWQGKYTDAVQQFDEAVRQDADYAAAYSKRGFANLRLKPPKLDSAIKDFQTALNKGADTYDVYWDLGWASYLAGDARLSIQYSQKALDANPMVCGPHFNIALALLASGALSQAETEYTAAIKRCETILTEALKAGAGAPASLWQDMQGAADDIDNLLCQTHHLHCYADRDQPSIKNVGDLEATRVFGERMRRRLKEALTSLEFQHTTTVRPSGASMQPLRFGNRINDEQGSYKSYVVRDVFPDDGQYIYALWAYTGMKQSAHTVFKVFRDGYEEVGLRYAYDWALDVNSTAEKQISGRLTLQPGEYRVEIYGDGELLTEGTFILSSEQRLPAPQTAVINPSARVSVANVLLADDFADNTHGWWTGRTDGTRVGTPAAGKFSVHVTDANDFWSLTCEDCGKFDNFYYEVGTRYVSGPETCCYGVVARADLAMENFYLFLISGDGSYRIDKVVGGKLTTFVGWTALTAINIKGSNRLGILARGNNLEFFINGQSVRRQSDAELSTGFVGVSIEHDGMDVAFSQVRVWQAR